MVTNPGWYGQVGVFLEAFSKWAFGFTYVHVCRVLIACYLVYDPTLLSCVSASCLSGVRGWNVECSRVCGTH